MSQIATRKNISFFRNRHKYYGEAVSKPGTYEAIRLAIGREIQGAKKLLDLGHGLVFNYDVKNIASVVAVDLFDKPSDDEVFSKNIRFVKGSALDLKFPDKTFDTVLMDMLLHHLVGKSSQESENNIKLAISEAFRVLKPRGKLIIVESCVARWFYWLEKIIFPLLLRFTSRYLSHPMVLQYSIEKIRDIISQFDP